MEFNWLTLNGKAAPATTPLIVKKGERVLPEEKYNDIMARIKAGKIEKPEAPAHQHKHGG